MHTSLTQLHQTGRSLAIFSVGVLATLGTLSLAHVGPVRAQSPGINLAALVAQVNALKAQQVADDATIATLKGTPVPGPKGDTGPQGIPGTNGANGKDGAAGAGLTADKIAVLSTLTLGDGVGAGTELTITGVNVHLIDGTGSTESGSGLGNLIIGYDAPGNTEGEYRTGSHNLILGDQNNYESSGGLVAGQDNVIAAPYATVSSGYYNYAGGSYASVSGGDGNTAYNDYSSVSGGSYNYAGSDYGSVSGGNNNSVTQPYASVSGGYGLTQSTKYGWSAGSEGATNYDGNFRSP